MLLPDEALQRVLDVARPLTPVCVRLADACGLVLAETVAANRDCPAFPRAMMDGFAVRSESADAEVSVKGVLPAGQLASAVVTATDCLEIMTGAPIPSGADAVVPSEQVERVGNRVKLPRKIEAGQHIASRGSECRLGEVVLAAGEAITALGIAALASFGVENVLAIPRPCVGIITTGSELAQACQPISAAQIRDSNGPMLRAMLLGLRGQTPLLLHAEDECREITDAIGQLANCHVVLLAGGVSAGKFDLVPKALAEVGAETVFHKVAQKPGKPLLFAHRKEQLFFGLPGNPLACHFCCQRYVVAAIRRLRGGPTTEPRWRGSLTVAVRPKGGRAHFLPALATPDESAPGAWQVAPTPSVSSADVFHSCRANCYLEVPPGREELPPGCVLPFCWIPGAAWTSARGSARYGV